MNSIRPCSRWSSGLKPWPTAGPWPTGAWSGFGLRDFVRDGSHLKTNGRTDFLRGRIHCANYPLTGYAPMEKDEWRRIFGIVRDWGLNHVRFHTWCPPDAAFEAADELGIYLHVELPNKRSGFRKPEPRSAPTDPQGDLDPPPANLEASLYEYAAREVALIFRHFGHHPSFVMFTLGNELGRDEGMYDLVERFRQRDPRRLYAQAANNVHWAPSLLKETISGSRPRLVEGGRCADPFSPATQP